MSTRISQDRLSKRSTSKRKGRREQRRYAVLYSDLECQNTGRFAAFEQLGRDYPLPPAETALGALLSHITGGADASTYQPMNINFGLFPPIDRPLIDENGKKIKRLKGRDLKLAMSQRGREKMSDWIAQATYP